MKVWVFAIALCLLSVQAVAKELRFFRLNLTLSMQDREDMHREFVIQENQLSRINMAPEGEPQVILEVVPEGIGRKTRAVKMACKVEAELENGEMKVLGKPKFTKKSRRPSSITAQSRDLPPFTLKVSVGEETNTAYVVTPDKDALVHRYGDAKD
jgi:hypothetical protein